MKVGVSLFMQNYTDWLRFDREQAFGYQPECYTPTGWLAATLDKWSRPENRTCER